MSGAFGTPILATVGAMTKPTKKDDKEHYLVRQRWDGGTFTTILVECGCGEKFKTKEEFVAHKIEANKAS